MSAEALKAANVEPPKVDLPALATEIKTEHQEVLNATSRIVQHAIAAGLALLLAKQSVEHWLPWLKDNCGLGVRTAQRYMLLAKNKDKLRQLLETSRVSQGSDDLSLAEAYRLIAEDAAPQASAQQSTSKGKGKAASANVSDKYDKAEDRLLKSIDRMQAEDAEAAAQRTIEQLVKIVSTKKGDKWKLKVAG